MESHTIRLGARIREERLRLRLTLESLAGSAGISTSFLGYIERGERQASLAVLGAIARALSVSIHELFSPDVRKRAGARDDAARRFAQLVRRCKPSKVDSILAVVKAMAAPS